MKRQIVHAIEDELFSIVPPKRKIPREEPGAGLRKAYATWPRSLIAAAIRHPVTSYSGVRRIIQNFHWETDKLPDVSYADIGYGPAKEKQLLRNYYDPAEFDRVKGIIERRRKKSGLSSAAVSLRAKGKESRSMGWCMLSLVWSRANRVETVDMHYRSTELIYKFAADLIFLRRLFKELGIAPTKIRFHFVNAFVSGGYLGSLGQHWPLLDFLDFLRQEDVKFFRSGTRVLLRSALRQNQSYRYSPHNQQHKLIWRFYDKKELREIAAYLKRNKVIAEEPVGGFDEDDE
jgi:hypothetical protein